MFIVCQIQQFISNHIILKTKNKDIIIEILNKNYIVFKIFILPFIFESIAL